MAASMSSRSVRWPSSRIIDSTQKNDARRAPPVTVALGATAARSLFGKVVTIGKMRGSPHELRDGSECWVTVHPSFLLRMPDEDRRREARAKFVEDLVRIRKRAERLEP